MTRMQPNCHFRSGRRWMDTSLPNIPSPSLAEMFWILFENVSKFGAYANQSCLRNVDQCIGQQGKFMKC